MGQPRRALKPRRGINKPSATPQHQSCEQQLRALLARLAELPRNSRYVIHRKAVALKSLDLLSKRRHALVGFAPQRRATAGCSHLCNGGRDEEAEAELAALLAELGL